MGKVKQKEIKNRTYFYNNIINLKNFKSNLKTDKKNHKGIDIYYIGYFTIKKIGDCEIIHSVNPLHLVIYQASGNMQEKNGNNYLIFDDFVNENRVTKKIRRCLGWN